MGELDRPYGWNPNLTQQQQDWLDSWFTRNKISAAPSSPILCHNECPYIRQCPLHIASIPKPIGRECPVERTLLAQWCEEMRKALNVGAEDTWSLMLLEYAGMWRLVIRRAMSEAGTTPVVVESYRGVDTEGNALYELKVNPAIMLADRALKTIQTIGKELIATREAKVKLSREREDVGPEERLRLVQKKIEDTINKVKNKEQQILDYNRLKSLPGGGEDDSS